MMLQRMHTGDGAMWILEKRQDGNQPLHRYALRLVTESGSLCI